MSCLSELVVFQRHWRDTTVSLGFIRGVHLDARSAVATITVVLSNKKIRVIIVSVTMMHADRCFLPSFSVASGLAASAALMGTVGQLRSELPTW